MRVFAELEGSRDNPDAGPTIPAEKGHWTWWRTGPHPQGVWQAMDWGAPGFWEAYAKNREDFPITQDQANGTPSDFGWVACHACDYLGEGYPSPGHYTACDGVCRRPGCRDHAPAPEVELEWGVRDNSNGHVATGFKDRQDAEDWSANREDWTVVCRPAVVEWEAVE